MVFILFYTKTKRLLSRGPSSAEGEICAIPRSERGTHDQRHMSQDHMLAHPSHINKIFRLSIPGSVEMMDVPCQISGFELLFML